MYFKQMYEEKLSQYAYLIGCQQTGEAIVIDPMRDIDRYTEHAEKKGFQITAAVDTHIHADYVSGLREFGERGVRIYASGEGGEDWKYEWLAGSEYNYELLNGGDSFAIGNIQFEVVYTPGHTPESVSLLVTDGAAAPADQFMGIFTGDFVFVGDIGRPDLLETTLGQKGAMKPAARVLYKSVENFKKLPEYLQVWPAHGAGSACGKSLGAVPMSTVGYELRFSPAFRASGSENEFVDFILDGQPEPPLYFSRMKKVNKEGPPLMRSIPRPTRMSLDELSRQDGIIIDSRDRHAYMKGGHIPGSLLATLGDDFNTVAGSYIDAGSNIYLIINQADVEEGVRDLIRVGLDNIKGYATPDELHEWGGKLKRIKAISFDEAERLNKKENYQVLDVRKASEVARGHIPGSMNIAHTRLADHLDELPGDKELLVHCARGRRASYASSFLAKEGFNVQWIDDDFKNREQKHDKSKTRT